MREENQQDEKPASPLHGQGGSALHSCQNLFLETEPPDHPWLDVTVTQVGEEGDNEDRKAEARSPRALCATLGKFLFHSFSNRRQFKSLNTKATQ